MLITGGVSVALGPTTNVDASRRTLTAGSKIWERIADTYQEQFEDVQAKDNKMQRCNEFVRRYIERVDVDAQALEGFTESMPLSQTDRQTDRQTYTPVDETKCIDLLRV